MMCRSTGRRMVLAALITSCKARSGSSVEKLLIRSFQFRAGRDAARAFATGCFATHQTHDIRGLSDREMAVRTASVFGYAERLLNVDPIALEFEPLEEVFRGIEEVPQGRARAARTHRSHELHSRALRPEESQSCSGVVNEQASRTS